MAESERVGFEFNTFDVNVVVTVTDAVSPPVRTDALEALRVRVASPISFTADAVVEEREAKPSAATSTSAMRLKAVVVDIDFLSEVVLKTFFKTAGKEILFAS
jgi:hypothetical protein